MKIQGSSNEQKFKSVEAALNRLSRRIKPEASVFIPPIPVSFFKNEFESNLIIGNYMFPAGGKITKSVIYLEFEKSKVPTQIIVSTELGTNKSLQSFEMQNRQVIEELNIDVPVGTRLSFELAEKPSELVSVWLGFLYQINVRHADVEKVALDNMGVIDERSDSED